MFYFLGSADYVCQTYNIDDDDFVKITIEILSEIGFNKQEIIKNLERFQKQSLTKKEYDFINAGANNFKKWMVDEDKNAPMLLSKIVL